MGREPVLRVLVPRMSLWGLPPPSQGLLWKMTSEWLPRRSQGQQRAGQNAIRQEAKEGGRKRGKNERIRELSYSESLCDAKYMKMETMLH